MTRRHVLQITALLAAITVLAAAALAQYSGRRGRDRGRDFDPAFDGDDYLLNESERNGVPLWEVSEEFKRDVFTFVRIQYDSGYYDSGYGGGGGGFFDGGFGRRRGYGRRGRGGWSRWNTDFPDSDLNFPLRLQQLTSLKVNPASIVRRLTDPDLGDYPFIYIIEPGMLVFHEDEVLALRKYLLSGGFLMVDDFWGDSEYYNFYEQIKRVFPDREPKELPLDHEIFNCVYRLKEKPQVNSINDALAGRPWGITWEEHHDGDVRTVHYQGIFDDKGRMMVIICHNTDLGDGWEREGMDEWYFSEFAEKKAYPMGINIVVYAMTH
jgi:hypothetical protein